MILDGIELFFIDYAPDPDLQVVYAPLHNFLCLVYKSETNEIITNVDYSGRKRLVDSINERQAIDLDSCIGSLTKAVPALDLAISNNCNLKCAYCHASAGERGNDDLMDRSMIKAILREYFEHISHNNSQKVTIGFNGGGEPAFHFNLLKYALDTASSMAAEKGIECEFTMATNGYYGKKTRDYIIKNFARVSISLDGPAYIQNLHRPAKAGGGSFVKVFETAKYFHANNYLFNFRVTVSAFSLPYLNEIIDFFAASFPDRSLKLEYLNPTGRAEKAEHEQVKPPDKKDFSRAIIDAVDYAVGKPIRIINAASTQVDRIRIAFCSNVGVPNWIVDPRGRIRACSRSSNEEAFLFGKYNIATGKVQLFEERIRALKKLTILHYEECKNCFMKYHCAGDCAERRLSDRVNCDAVRKTGMHLLAQKIHPANNNAPLPG